MPNTYFLFILNHINHCFFYTPQDCPILAQSHVPTTLRMTYTVPYIPRTTPALGFAQPLLKLSTHRSVFGFAGQNHRLVRSCVPAHAPLQWLHPPQPIGTHHAPLTPFLFPTNIDRARSIFIGWGQIAQPRSFSSPWHPCTSTTTLTPPHTLSLHALHCNFDGQAIPSACARYLALGVKTPAPARFLHCGLPPS